MDPPTGAAPQRRAFSRVPLRAKVRMEFVEQRCFLGEWAVNVSPGGMFVRSEAQVAPGQRFDFDAALTPSGPRFLGRGEVLWVRQEWEGASRPPGFAVRFLELEEAGRLAILRLGEVFLRDGVAAMQEELAAMAADWQRQRLEDEPTGEIDTGGEDEGVLPDTAVISPPSDLAPEPARGAQGAGASQAPAAPPAPQHAAEVPAVESAPPVAAPPAGRGRAGWLAGLALLVAVASLLGWWRWSVAEPVVVAARGAAPDGPPGAAVARPVAAALPASAAPAPPPPFESLRGVSWSESPEGLWVTLSLDGELPAGAYRHWRAAAPPPREVVELLGARRGYPRQQVEVGSPLLRQIRFGFHPGEGGDELRVVLDLPSQAVSVRRVESEGAALRVLLGMDETPQAPPRPLDLPSGTAQ